MADLMILFTFSSWPHFLLRLPNFGTQASGLKGDGEGRGWRGRVCLLWWWHEKPKWRADIVAGFVKGRWKMATLNASVAHLSTTATQPWVPLLPCPSCSATTRSSVSLANFTCRLSQQLRLGDQLTWKVSSTSSTQALKIRRRGIAKSLTCPSPANSSAHEVCNWAPHFDQWPHAYHIWKRCCTSEILNLSCPQLALWFWP